MEISKHERRALKFQELCLQYNMKYMDKDEFGVKTLLKYFELYRSNGKITNLCKGNTDEFHVTRYCFDYEYLVRYNNYVKRYKQTVFFTSDRSLHLPVFLLKPENLGNKIAAFFGWEDIDFESHPGFSNEYHLSGEDEPWVRDNFKEPVLTFFSKTSGWHVEATNHYILFYALDSIIPENILFDFYKMGLFVHQLFKESQKELLPV